MNKFYFLCLGLMLIGTTLYGQTGIYTREPKASLDIEGDLRIQDVNKELIQNINSILVIDSNNIVKLINKRSFETTEDFKKKTYALVPKKEDQTLPLINIKYPVSFDFSEISGINVSGITTNSDQNEITFPPNKAFVIKAYVGIRGKLELTTNYPAYVTSKFENVGTGANIIYSSWGFVESSTRFAEDSGGNTNPSIMFLTGPNGGTIKLMASYGGENSNTSTDGIYNPNGYDLAGDPTFQSVGSYLIIEEL